MTRGEPAWVSLPGRTGRVVGVGCDALGTQPVPSFLKPAPLAAYSPGRPAPDPPHGRGLPPSGAWGPLVSSARRGRIRRSWEPVVPAEGAASGAVSWAPRVGTSAAEGAGRGWGPPALDRLEAAWVTARGV